MTRGFPTHLGAPVVHMFPNGHVLRNDQGIRDDEESYSLFMKCPDDRQTENSWTYTRQGIYTGPREWAIAECEKKIATLEYNPVEDEWRETE